MAKDEQKKRGCLGGCLTNIFQLIVLSFVLFIAFVIFIEPGTGSNERLITASQYGDEWPFTVQSGTLKCESGRSVVFINDGRRYAVNGTARDRQGVRPTEQIWLNNPEIPGTKISVGPLIRDGLALCAN